MGEAHIHQDIHKALGEVEHPAIATSLLELGMLRDIEVTSEGKVTLTMVLPFPNIPDNVRNTMVNSLAAAAQSAGGELTKLDLAMMNEEEREKFLIIEQQNWRG